MSEPRKISLLKPTLETPFCVDFDWWQKNDNNWRISLRDMLCPEHQEAMAEMEEDHLIDWIDPKTGEVSELEGLQTLLINHCAKQEGFLDIQVIACNQRTNQNHHAEQQNGPGICQAFAPGRLLVARVLDEHADQREEQHGQSEGERDTRPPMSRVGAGHSRAGRPGVDLPPGAVGGRAGLDRGRRCGAVREAREHRGE